MLNEVRSDIKSAIAAAAKVRVEGNSENPYTAKLNDSVDTIIDSIDYINSLGRYSRIIDGELIDEIELPSDFIEFVQPKTVSIDPLDEQSIDFRLREVSDYQFSIEKLNRAVTAYLTIMRQDRGCVSKVSSKRVNLSLLDAIGRCTMDVDGITYVHCDKDYFIPVVVKSKDLCRFYEDEYYNMESITVIKRFISRTFN